MGWPEWPQALGVEADSGGTDATGVQFTNYIRVIQAAAEGQGIALAWRRLVDPMLERGDLVRVTDDVVVPEPSYDLILPDRRTTRSPIETFQRWLLKEARRDW